MRIIEITIGSDPSQRQIWALDESTGGLYADPTMFGIHPLTAMIDGVPHVAVNNEKGFIVPLTWIRTETQVDGPTMDIIEARIRASIAECPDDDSERGHCVTPTIAEFKAHLRDVLAACPDEDAGS